MILFDKVNPLDELAEVVRLANPETAKDITGDNIAVDNIKAIDPLINEGFNTECEIRMIGVGSAVGLVKVRFTRIDLRNYVPNATATERVRVGVVTAANKRADIVKIAPRAAKAFGTMFDVTGPHKDYTNVGTYIIQKGATVDNYFDIGVNSLRYVPCRWYFKSFGLGMEMEEVIHTPGVVPYLNDNGSAKYGGVYEPPLPYMPEEGKRSSYMTMGNLDFTSVWGTDPTKVIVPSNDPDMDVWRFTDEAFAKINLILSTAGLPPLPRPDFANWSRAASAKHLTPRWTELNYYVYIHYGWCQWDYHNIANLHGESTNLRDYTLFNYRT